MYSLQWKNRTLVFHVPGVHEDTNDFTEDDGGGELDANRFWRYRLFRSFSEFLKCLGVWLAFGRFEEMISRSNGIRPQSNYF